VVPTGGGGVLNGVVYNEWSLLGSSAGTEAMRCYGGEAYLGLQDFLAKGPSTHMAVLSQALGGGTPSWLADVP
jgi:hypothetical protein